MKTSQRGDITQTVIKETRRLPQSTYQLLCHLGIAKSKKTRRGTQAGRKKHKPAASTHNQKLKIVCLNVRSCRQKATDVHELITDLNIDIMSVMFDRLPERREDCY